jgi:hypothetical protein
MSISRQQIAELERINYQALLPVVQAMPGAEVLLHDEAILNSSPALPLPDSNHACLLQAAPEKAEALLDEILAYFEARGVPPAFFISPACAPADWPQRLEGRGLVKQPSPEYWITYDHLQTSEIPPLSPAVEVKTIGAAAAPDMAAVFVATFEMPASMAPVLAEFLAPSMGLPGSFHYLAEVKGQAIGCCSLVCYQQYGILGNVGVLAGHRGGRAAYNLVTQAASDAKKQGVDTFMLQTTSGLVARLSHLYGFKTVFTRICYTLNDDAS